jgi:hypothetical protein
MTYKETLFFIGKCLTITHEEDNKLSIEKELNKNTIDWDAVVKVSTAHYVFPALYCNLKRAHFLHYLPTDLVEYMKHITDLNRERNQQIIEQAKEINELLVTNNITPIFLKGTGNLLDDLYEDIAERMVGDIDFLVDPINFKKSFEFLKKDSYNRIDKNRVHFKFVNKHLPRIIKKNRVCAVEVHKNMLPPPHDSFFNYFKIFKKKNKSNFFVLSDKDQIIYNCFNKQVNDKAQWFKNISLRNSYDLFLLSKRASPIFILKNFNYLFEYLNNYLATSFFILNKPSSLKYDMNLQTIKHLLKVKTYLNDPIKNKLNKTRWDIYFFFKIRFKILKKSLHDKETRKTLLKRLTSFRVSNKNIVIKTPMIFFIQLL